MMILKDILYKVSLDIVIGATDVSINQIQFDSRAVQSDDVFVALKGSIVDGHDYIEKAVSKGATAVILEELPDYQDESVTYIKVENAHNALALMADNFYDNPSKKLKLVGVTGTNGKTTTTSLLYQLFKKSGFKTGLISTVEILIDEKIVPTKHTTPDPITINKHLADMATVGVDYCFMEVSSHGIAQERVTGLEFAGGVFTNLSHDHLDYHNSFAEYRDVKKRFFDELPKQAFALSNLDDKNGAVMLQNTKAKKIGYALKSFTDYRAQILENQFGGLLLKINEHEVWSKMVGQFNAYNVLAIYACAIELGLEAIEVLEVISRLEGVAGRFQYFTTIKNNITAIVDYAHTPDALKNVLETINSIRTRNERVITVVGCGGDRDSTKRPKMAHIAAALSDQVIFTSDNPRTEDPQKILDDMEEGVQPQDFKKTITILDRRQAIKAAAKMADKNDIILIAGKGHETYQEINGVRSDFNDRTIIADFLNQLQK
ncbi:UDP-N-acetylmuramoyl-L-alanyl-D-glutamate--2,6-diaminopimelate ligase [Nonlabens dokdonensis]|uniref:UDP-N-acetylmuramoyl-L-alanyl-D-glutamate--2,6-diaminopimelate ligase n=1 Tax=Nonlabens dokdonensis TaxID=328515 RepID=A0A1Z8ANM3_9FLAO|nr:UDP-N-acetylmuramoyl-L-alanyl-D-glutamate--2,6-diaminopimelate ligase [Nonlabens dokdonensis]OUS11929.1 UDP-N-acetylmuramoyl-L-alanyl-D-glutamate--2,6-diaminopimelate ligase [Nonlabens dokdonensis]